MGRLSPLRRVFKQDKITANYIQSEGRGFKPHLGKLFFLFNIIYLSIYLSLDPYLVLQKSLILIIYFYKYLLAKEQQIFTRYFQGVIKSAIHRGSPLCLTKTTNVHLRSGKVPLNLDFSNV